ncbi:MAG: hypothetical protein ACXWYM_00300 [Candidatus Binatia bacterium]
MLIASLSGIMAKAGAAGLRFDGYGIGQSGTNTESPTTALPPGIAAGDILIFAAVVGHGSDGAVPQIVAPTGFTDLENNASGSTTTGDKYRSKVAYKVADGTESGSLSWVSEASCRSASAILRFSNVSAIDVTESGGSSSSGAASDDAPSATTTVAGCKIVTVATFGTTQSGTRINGTPAAQTNYVNITDGGTNSAYGVNLAISVSDQVAAGATGTFTYTQNDVVSDGKWSTVTIAIAP